MKAQEIINNFLNTKSYSKQELDFFVMGYVNNKIDDQAMTQFLKSIYDHGLSIEDTANLTEIMMHSGDTIDLSTVPGIKVDKHSTGGVGDKVSIIVAPIVAAFDVPVAKMSGRGLGFTGGTLDKLESIPGYNIFLSDDRFKKQLIDHKISIIGQTNNLVPADKKMYALRDETNLIASMPLIASSIMSKKLATGADAILLDVKCGDAAFMKTQQDAETLAKWMIDLGKHLGKDVKAEITSMTTPLGKMIGNKNEIIESINFLKNKNIPNDLKEVIYSSAGTMLMQAKVFSSIEDAKKAIEEKIASGEALEKFKTWIKAQDGDVEVALSNDFWRPKYKKDILASKDGFMEIKQAVVFGEIAMKLGAGREKKEDDIDYEAGIEIHKKTGDNVNKNDVIFTLYSSNSISDSHLHAIENAYQITDEKINKRTIINKL